MQYLLLFIVLIISFPVVAFGNRQDTVPTLLENIVVSRERYSSAVRNSDMQSVVMDMGIMHLLPKILGNADPLHYSQLLPGVQTNAEYDAGLHIHGCDNSHNIVSLSGVPVYNASHMLGLFSTFNASHFSHMMLNKSATAADGVSRIGGMLDMQQSDTLPEQINGEFSVGIISSQGTLRVPIDEQSALTASLRLSYLNLLYSSLLEIDGCKLNYSFADVNVTYINKINRNNTLYIDFYTGKDNISSKDNSNELYFNTTMKWGNMLAAAHWKYIKNNTEIKQSLFYTGYSNKMYLKGKYDFKLPSGIYDFGYRLAANSDNIKLGLFIYDHHIEPQNPECGSYGIKKNEDDVKQHSVEMSAYIAYSDALFEDMTYELALKGDYYNDKGSKYSHTALNPSVTILYKNIRLGRFKINYSQQRQYLFNCGFTSIGFPVEFWFGSDEMNKPQMAHSYHLSWQRELFDGKYIIDITSYYKNLYNQVEYNASPLELLNKKYDMNENILNGRGNNYGVSININKCSGKVTGWVAYTYSRAMRKFEEFGNKWYPANHERIHELNAITTFRINDKFDIGATFVYASGTPFTAPRYFYMVNGNVITEFGDHNANRLEPYMRLDLSFNYDIIKRETKRAGINISLYNALFRSNQIYYRFKVYEEQYAYRGVSFFSRILPSISYYYKF